ncbi:metallophosphoesterase [Halobellus clavatus]|jgi:Icc-related predicted phosphoesterase|uniref:Calcineurin-like phosphoesterase n=1 Tax=Halobellus clavatus TaxID=660517 RepID=A0A1H3J6M6_9EURY|nr:metallophosphoesterase [Halobellus clavatus]SDY35552.1 Calcineurin-like phosphoesterase [Halobellus clavatus]
MRVLVCNDLHLKPVASDYDIDAMETPDDIDAVFIAGDLTHRDGADDIALARRFIDQFDIDVLYVPGNHDHTPMPVRVAEGFEHVTNGHNMTREYESCSVVGWGCESRSLDDALDQAAFPTLDPRTAPRGERRYRADQTASAIENALHSLVTDQVTTSDAADELGIADENIPTFHQSVHRIQETYDHLSDLVGDRSNVVIVSHLSPFNTSFDRHHSTGTREEDREAFHTGSIALKLIIKTHDVYATVSGHSHASGYETGDSEIGAPHMLNLGYRGLGVVDICPTTNEFSFVEVNTS